MALLAEAQASTQPELCVSAGCRQRMKGLRSRAAPDVVILTGCYRTPALPDCAARSRSDGQLAGHARAAGAVPAPCANTASRPGQRRPPPHALRTPQNTVKGASCASCTLLRNATGQT